VTGSAVPGASPGALATLHAFSLEERRKGVSTQTDPPWPGRVRYPYHSLEDFLTAEMLTVDGVLDDGWRAIFPVRGREIEAAGSSPTSPPSQRVRSISIRPRRWPS
jgi:hypothetical protein